MNETPTGFIRVLNGINSTLSIANRALPLYKESVPLFKTIHKTYKNIKNNKDNLKNIIKFMKANKEINNNNNITKNKSIPKIDNTKIIETNFNNPKFFI